MAIPNCHLQDFIQGVPMRFATRLYLAGLFGVLSLSAAGAANAQPIETASVGMTAVTSPSDSSGMGASTLAGKVYSLHLHHLHTGESLDVVYRIGDTYIPEALAQLNHFLRDHRTDDASHYDPKEFDLLHNIMAKLGRPNGIIDIVCGYRTPWSNAFLRHGSAASGVAEHSQHMEAKAIDIRVPGVQTAKLRDTAESFDAGGVGYYPVSQFVHVDVGPVRTWSFGGSTHAKTRVRTVAAHRRGHGQRGVIHHYGN